MIHNLVTCSGKPINYISFLTNSYSIFIEYFSITAYSRISFVRMVSMSRLKRVKGRSQKAVWQETSRILAVGTIFSFFYARIDPVCNPRDFSIPRANFCENVSRMPVGLHNCRFKGYNLARAWIPRELAIARKGVYCPLLSHKI